MNNDTKDKARSMRIKALKQAIKQVTNDEELIALGGDEPTSPAQEQFLEQVLDRLQVSTQVLRIVVIAAHLCFPNVQVMVV